MKNIIKFLVPDFILKKYHAYRYTKNDAYGWSGDYSSWQEVMNISTGYNADEIFNRVDKGLTEVINGRAAFERDSVAFKELIYSEDLLKLFKTISNEHHNHLRLIDFGGALGSIYYQYRKLLSGVVINWSVVEQGEFVRIGIQKYSNQEINFFYTIDEALNSGKQDVLFMSSVLAYLPDPESFLKQMIEYKIKYIVLYRTAFVQREKPLLTLQQVPPEFYNASYPAWFFNEKKIKSILEQYYTMLDSFDGDIETTLKVGKNDCYWKCLVFKLK